MDLFKELYLQDFLIRKSPIYGSDFSVENIVGYNYAPTISIKKQYAIEKTKQWIKKNNYPLEVFDNNKNSDFFQVINISLI